jgi:hypothetical protein
MGDDREAVTAGVGEIAARDVIIGAFDLFGPDDAGIVRNIQPSAPPIRTSGSWARAVLTPKETSSTISGPK